MSEVVEEKEKKRLREDSKETVYNNFSDGTAQGHTSKKKKQVETKQWLKSRARKPRVGSEFQVNIATVPDLQPKLQKATNKDTAVLKQG